MVLISPRLGRGGKHPYFHDAGKEIMYGRSVSQHMAPILVQHQDVIGDDLSHLAGDEYLEDIMRHLEKMEDETLPNLTMIDNQRDIRWHMRPYLIDFLIDVHSAYSMLSETLFLAINLLDRYCSKRQVLRQHYQLAGCVALFIAAKYGDKKCNTPYAKELNRMCRGVYEIRLFSQMELHVLDSLGWIVGHPTGELFAKVFVAEHGDDKEVEYMAAYLREIALYHRSFVSTKPSVMARSSLALARTILNRKEVNGGGEDEASTSSALSRHLREPSTTLVRKYSTYSLCQVSQKLAEFVSRESIKTHRIVHISIPHIGVINKFANGFCDGVEDSNGAITIDGTSSSSDISESHTMQKTESFNEHSASNGCLEF